MADNPVNPPQAGEPPANPPAIPAGTASLVIAPPSVTLNSAQAQIFTATPTQPVTWSLLPDDGSSGHIDPQSGAYTAPRFVWRNSMAVVRAQGASAIATAEINLSCDLFWRNMVGVLLLVLILLTAYFTQYTWPALCKCDYSPSVTPAVSWLNPGDTLPLNLAHCAPRPDPISWKVASGPGAVSDLGVYTAANPPAGTPPDAVVQALDADKKVIASAVIHVSNDPRLTIWPALVGLDSGQYQTFTISTFAVPADVHWSLDPGAPGKLEPAAAKPPMEAKYTAPDVNRPMMIRMTATVDPGAGKPSRSVAALVQLSPANKQGCASAKDIYWFVFWMGLLGSLIHAALSFAAYAGNRKFVASWTWWYMLRPLTGGLLAVLVFFLFGGGVLGKSDVSNAYMVATYAGLVGLFSETAVLKLKELFETLLKPKEERSDKISGQDGSVPKPVISAVTVENAAEHKFAVTGSGFQSGARVKVGAQPRTTVFVSNSKLIFTLADTDKGTVQVVVSNPKPDGTTVDSAPAPLIVP